MSQSFKRNKNAAAVARKRTAGFHLKRIFVTKTDGKNSIPVSKGPTVESSYCDDGMKAFFDNVETVRFGIDKIKEAADQIVKLGDLAKTCTSSSEEAANLITTQQLESVVNKTGPIITTIIWSLKDLKEGTQEAENLSSTNDSAMESSALAIRSNLITLYSRKLKEEVSKYQQAQGILKRILEETSKRQLQMLDPTRSDDAVSAFLKSGRKTQVVVIQEKILSKEAMNHRVIDSCYQAESKYDGIIILEKSIQQLRQLFVDMAVLTEAQGAVLDRIEVQIQEANDDVTRGIENVKEVCHTQKRYRRKQFGLILIAVAIVAVLVVILAF